MTDQDKIRLLTAISNEMDLDKILDLMGSEIARLDLNNYGIYLADEKCEFLVIRKVGMKEEFKEFQSKQLNYLKLILTQNTPFSECFRSQKTLIVNEKDFERYEYDYKHYFSYWKFKSMAMIPFMKNNKIIGVVHLIGKPDVSQRAIDEVVELCQLFFQPVVNMYYVAELKSREAEVKTIYSKAERILSLAGQINNLDSIENVYRLITKELLMNYNFDIGNIYLQEQDVLRSVFMEYISESVRESYSPKAQIINHYLEEKGWFNIEKNDGAMCRLFLNNTSYFIADFQLIKNSVPFTEKDRFTTETAGTIRSILYIPIRKNDKPIGIIGLMSIEKTVNIAVADIKAMESLCTFISTAIENARIYTLVEEQKKNLEEKDLIIREDLMLAKRIQQNFISKEYKKYKDLDFFIHYQPQYEIGGDIYDIFQFDKKRYRIFIADATGHGIQASLTTVIIKNEYEMIKRHQEQPHLLLQELNQSFISKYYHLSVFFTALILDVDLEHNKIIYSSAGHPEQIVIQKDKLVHLKTAGKMVGLYENVDYKLMEHSIDLNDRLILFTDGLFEEFNENNEEFGYERLEKAVTETACESLRESGEYLLSELNQFTGQAGFQDDICLISIAIK